MNCLEQICYIFTLSFWTCVADQLYFAWGVKSGLPVLPWTQGARETIYVLSSLCCPFETSITWSRQRRVLVGLKVQLNLKRTPVVHQLIQHNCSFVVVYAVNYWSKAEHLFEFPCRNPLTSLSQSKSRGI